MRNFPIRSLTMLKRSLAAATAMILLALSSARAAQYDLFPGAVVTQNVDGAIYQGNYDHPTGTGVYNPFVREQAGSGNGSEFEYGFNTDQAINDVVESAGDTLGSTHTHSLNLGNLKVVTNPGNGVPDGSYFVFSLDANQQSQGSNGSESGKVSLLELQIWLGDTAEPTVNTEPILGSSEEYVTAFTSAGAHLKYSLDSLNNNVVNIDSALNNGSGSGDLTVFIPTSLFDGENLDQFLYLYSSFGVPDPQGTIPGATYYANNDGFEEWKAVTGENVPNPVPEPSRVALALSGLGTLGLVGLRRNRRRTERASD